MTEMIPSSEDAARNAAVPGTNLGNAPVSNARPRSESTPGESAFFNALPSWVWIAFGVLAAAGIFSPNQVLTPLAVLAVPVLAGLLWFGGEPPVLAFACLMQWLQCTVAVFYTDYYGQSLDEASGGPEMGQATMLSLGGVVALAVGIRFGLRGWRPGPEQLRKETQLLVTGKIFVLYLFAFVLFNLISRIGLIIPGLQQPIAAIVSLRWALIFLLFHAVLSQRKDFGLLLTAVLIELAVGVIGYFGGFKEVLFLLLVALTVSREIFRGWRLALGLMLVVLLLGLGVIWSTIKSDYREFLNQGTGEQVVLVPIDERLAKLNELVSALDASAVDDGLNRMILRISYVTLFAQCISHVPSQVGHEHGALWLGAFKHVFMPRIFFPDKPVIDDSAQASKYTGVNYAGMEQGTSIGIGYMAQSYIDFGKWGMFAPVFLLGILYGFTYRYFVGRKHKILGVAMATAILIFAANKVETSNIKLIGGNTMALLVIGIFMVFAGDWLWRAISRPDHPERTKPAARRGLRRPHRSSRRGGELQS